MDELKMATPNHIYDAVNMVNVDNQTESGGSTFSTFSFAILRLKTPLALHQNCTRIETHASLEKHILAHHNYYAYV